MVSIHKKGERSSSMQFLKVKKARHYKKVFLGLSSLLCMLIILSSFGFATNVFSNTYHNQIGTQPNNIFLQNENYNNAYAYSFSSSGESSKVCDIDGDGIKELITFSGNTIYAFKGTNNIGEPDTSFTIDSGYNIQDLVCVRNEDTDGVYILTIAIATGGSSVQVASYERSGTSLIKGHTFFTKTGTSYSANSTLDCQEYSYIGDSYYNCAYAPQYATGKSLIVLRNDNVLIGEQAIEVRVDNGTWFTPNNDSTVKKIPFGTNGNDVVGGKTGTAWGRFGDIVYFSDVYNDALVQFQIADCALALDYDSTESLTNCTYTYNNIFTDTDFAFMSRPYIIDYNGQDYVCVGYGFISGSQRVGVNCLSPSLVSKHSHEQGSSSATAIQFFDFEGFSLDIDSDNYQEFCYSGATDKCQSVKCIDVFNANDEHVIDTGAYVTDERVQLKGFVLDYFNNPLIVSYDNDGDVFEYYNISDTYATTTISGDSIEAGYFVFDDISGDGSAEMVGFSSSKALMYFFEPQEASTITLYGNGVYGYYNPACNGTTVTFKAKQCQDTLNCTYSSDNIDPFEQEKLCTTCGGTKALSCGSYSYTNPFIQCDNFTNTGTYDITFSMYTDANENDIAKVFTLEDFVVSSSACNQDEDFEDVSLIGGQNATGETGTGTGTDAGNVNSSDPDSLIEALLPNSTLWRIVIGISMILGLMLLVGSYGGKSMHPSIYAFVGILGLILTTALGLLPSYILIIGLIGMVLMIIVSKYLSTGGG